MSVRREWSGDEECWFPPEAPNIEVTCSDPVVLGVLYGPRGELLGTVVDRRSMQFGFQAGSRS